MANFGCVEESGDGLLRKHPTSEDLVSIAYHPSGDVVANDSWGPKYKCIIEPIPGGGVSENLAMEFNCLQFGHPLQAIQGFLYPHNCSTHQQEESGVLHLLHNPAMSPKRTEKTWFRHVNFS